MQSKDEPPKQTRGSDNARKWASYLAGEFGKAVKQHRLRSGLTMVQLADRTKQLGYPITRGTIAKIESNTRNSKMDMAEVLTLSSALSVPVGLLIFPSYPNGPTLPVPSTRMSSVDAMRWLCGETIGPTPREFRDFEGSDLIRLVRQRKEITEQYTLENQIEARSKGVGAADLFNFEELERRVEDVDQRIFDIADRFHGEG